MLGQRQNLASASLTTTTGGASVSFTVDREFRVRRIKFWPTDGAMVNIGDITLQIQAEGELLFSGNDVPLTALCIKTDDGSAQGVSAAISPFVLAFDREVVLSKDYPLTVRAKHTLGAKTFWVIIEGP